MIYDIVVVGAGPAGSSASYNLAKKGFKTLLLDKKKLIGQPKQCAEGINQHILEELDLKLKPEWIDNKIDSAVISNGDRFIYGQGKRTRGFILDRKKFDPGLAQKAQNAGAELRTQAEVIGIKNNILILKNKEQIKTKIIIGADGTLSIIGKKSGLGNPLSGTTLQYEIEKQTPYPHAIQCFFGLKITDRGWSWIFPKKDTMNVGIGSFEISNLKTNLNYFMRYMKLSKLKVKEVNGGLIPLHGPLHQFQKNNILLIGDAAGHTNPLSGGGIPVAIFDGQLVTKIITKHLEKNSPLDQYQSQWWQSDFGQATKKSLKAQKIYLDVLKKGKIDRLFERIGNQKIYSVKKAWNMVKRVPLLDMFTFYRFARYSLESFEYA